jgi:drug/metabolite transporter (DMT)-like permease
MPLLHDIAGWAFLLLIAAGLVCVASAGRHLAPSVEEPFQEFHFRRGLFGPREMFTAVGWRYRNLALRLLGAALLALVLWAASASVGVGRHLTKSCSRRRPSRIMGTRPRASSSGTSDGVPGKGGAAAELKR